jgi:hypothetical protein
MSREMILREPAHGSMNTPQEKLTRTAKGEYGGDEPPPELSDEDQADLDKIHKILRKKPHLRAHTSVPVESYRPAGYDAAALLQERERCLAMNIDPDKHFPLPPDFEQRFQEQWHAGMDTLADCMVGSRLTKDSGVDKATRRRRDEARMVMAYGRRRLMEMGVLPR